MTSRWPKKPPRGPHDASQEGPPYTQKIAQLVCKMHLFHKFASRAFRRSKTAQEAPKTAPRRPKRPQQKGPTTAQDGPKTAQEVSNTAQKGS
eukprot:3933541-Pyramimonas_sp.AAC.1